VLIEDDAVALAIISAGMSGLQRGTANMLTDGDDSLSVDLAILMAARGGD